MSATLSPLQSRWLEMNDGLDPVERRTLPLQAAGSSRASADHASELGMSDDVLDTRLNRWAA